MDPIGVVFATLSIINAVNQIFELARKIRRVEGEKVDQLFYRSVLEKKRTEGWANSMRVTSNADIRGKIPPDEFENVQVLLGRLNDYYEHAARRLERFITAQEQTERGLIARVKLAYGGYDDFKDLLDTVSTMNAALYAIAPPFPPGYSPVPHQLDYTDTRLDQMRSLPAFAEANVPNLASDPILSGGSTPLRQASLTPVQGADAEQENAEPKNGLTLQILYDRALRSMEIIANARNDFELTLISHRLQIWGSGLFDSRFPLDQILLSNEEDGGLVPKCIRKALVKILVLEERELTHLSSETDGVQQGRFQSARDDISLLLVTEETFALVTMVWKSVIEDQEEDPERKPKDITFTAKIIESLFDLLPTIMTTRQTFYLRLESSQKDKTQITDKDTFPVLRTNSDNTVDGNLQAIKSALKSRDEEARRRGQSTRFYEPIFDKVLERRAELLKTHERIHGPKTKDKTIPSEKEKEINEATASFVENMKIKAMYDEKAGRSKISLEKSDHKDELRISLEEKDAIKVDVLIEYLTSTNSELSNLSNRLLI